MVKYGADAQLREDHVFGAVHPGKAAVGSIVESTQVQHAVKRVQQQLILHRNIMLPSTAASLRDAHDDLAGNRSPARIQIQREGQYIGRAGDSHESFVQLAHAFIVHKNE